MIKVNGISFDDNTPKGIINAIVSHMNQTIRVFYGDAETGRDWCEEYMTHGDVYLSRGGEQYPCFCNSKLYTTNIVKIIANGRTIYQHPNYHQPKFTIGLPPVKIGDTVMADDGYTHGVYLDGENTANFKSEKQAQRWVDYMTGKRTGR